MRRHLKALLRIRAILSELILFSAAAAGVFAAGTARAGSLPAIHDNNMGVEALNEEKARQAESLLLQALVNDPFNPQIRFNLGTAYLAQQKFSQAVKEYQSVLRNPATSPELAFMANFNAAIAAQESKNIDLALDFYQKALALKPDSREVKVNIELLTSQQSGQGQGQGEGQADNQDPNQQGQGQGQGQEPQNENGDNEKNNNPQKGQNFSKDELKKIFEELERQEQKVRALEYGTKGGREKGPSKDW